MSNDLNLPPRPRLADLPVELQAAPPRPNRWRHWCAGLPPDGFTFDQLVGWHVAIARCETEIIVEEREDRAEQTFDFVDHTGVPAQRRTTTVLDGSFAGFEANRRPERSVTTELVLYGPALNECTTYPSRGMAPRQATTEIPFRVDGAQVATTTVALNPQLVDVRTLDERRGPSIPGAPPLVHALPPRGPMGYALRATVPLIARQLGCSEQEVGQRFAIVDATDFIARLTRLPAGRPLLFLAGTGEAARVLANLAQQVLVADGMSGKTVAYFNGSVEDWLNASTRRPQVEVATVSRSAAPTPSDPSSRWLEWVLGQPDDLARIEGWRDALNRERDPRGRFVELQLAAERTQSNPSPEEQRLLNTHWREWCGGLAGMQRDGLVFRRGLLIECRYAPTGEGLDAHVWKSVRRLELQEESRSREPCTELASPHLMSVEFIEGAAPSHLEALLAGGSKAKLTELGCIHLSNRSRHVERLSLFSNLKVLRSWYGSATPDDLGQSAPIMAQLERLEFVSDRREHPALPNLAIALERAGMRRVVFVRNASQVEYELRPRELVIRFLNDAVFESQQLDVARALMHHVKAFDRVDGFVGARRLGFFARRKLTQLMRESLARG